MVRTISTAGPGTSGVHPADLDGDGDLDVLSASSGVNHTAWYENDGAAVPGFTLRTISTTAADAEAVHAADLDGDGDMDVLSASFIFAISGGGPPATLFSTVAWYENDGSPDPGFTLRTISNGGGNTTSVYAVDVDGDGDADVDGNGEVDVLSAGFFLASTTRSSWTPRRTPSASSTRTISRPTASRPPMR